MMTHISFGIKTNLKSEPKLLLTICSILAQKMPENHFEILITGNCTFKHNLKSLSKNIRLIPDKISADQGKLAQMMNTLCHKAHFENIVLMDDDIVLTDGWIDSLKNFLEDKRQDWDALAFPIRNTDGTRFWDWAIHHHISGQSHLIPTDIKDPDIYISGGMAAVKKKVWDKIRWNSELGFYEGEDVDWSKRLIKAGYRIEYCKNAYVLHNDGRYFQMGDRVHRSNSLDEVATRQDWQATVEDYLRHNPAHEFGLSTALDKPNYHAVPRPVTRQTSLPKTTAPLHPEEELTVLWCARFSHNSEYREDALNYLSLLKIARIPTVAFDLDSADLVTNHQGYALDIQTTYNGDLILHTKNPKVKFITIIHERPDWASHIIVKGSPTICYFDLQVHQMPGFWRPMLDKYDQVWVSSKSDQQRIIDSGYQHALYIPRFLETHFHNPDYPSPKLSGLKAHRILTIVDSLVHNDIKEVISAYQKAFTSEDEVSLVILCNQAIPDKEFKSRVTEHLNPAPSSPHIHVVKKPLQLMDRVGFYNLCHSYVCIDYSANDDRFSLEAVTSGLGLICLKSSYSSELKSPGNAFLVKTSTLQQPSLNPSLAQIRTEIETESYCSIVDTKDLAEKMKSAVENPEEHKQKAERAKKEIRLRLDPDQFKVYFREPLKKTFFKHSRPEGQTVSIFSPKLNWYTQSLKLHQELAKEKEQLHSAAEHIHKRLDEVLNSKAYRIGHQQVQVIKLIIKVLRQAFYILTFQFILQKLAANKNSTPKELGQAS